MCARTARSLAGDPEPACDLGTQRSLGWGTGHICSGIGHVPSRAGRVPSREGHVPSRADHLPLPRGSPRAGLRSSRQWEGPGLPGRRVPLAEGDSTRMVICSSPSTGTRIKAAVGSCADLLLAVPRKSPRGQGQGGCRAPASRGKSLRLRSLTSEDLLINIYKHL